MEGEKTNMSVSKEEIEKIKNKKIFDDEWDTSDFPYMSDKQIIEVHRYIYNTLIEGFLKFQDAEGNILVPLLVKHLLIETKNRLRKERCKKLGNEISAWIHSEPNDTLSRLRRFYNSIISIHLGGEGIMEKHRSLMNNDAPHKEVKDNWRKYKLNYPNKLHSYLNQEKQEGE